MKLRNVFFGSLMFYLLIFSESHAQQNDSSWVNDIFVGPMVGINGSMNTTDYHVSNVKRDVGIGFDIGAIATYKFEQSSAVMVGLHYYNLAFQDNNEYVFADAFQKSMSRKLTTSGNFSYITFSAMLRAYVVLIGLKLAIPAGGTAKNSFGESTSMPDQNGVSSRIKEGSVSISSSDMNFLVIPQIGFEIPVAQREAWVVNIGLVFGYTLQNISKSPFTLPKMVDNYKLPNAQFSVSYTFAPWKSAAKN